MRLGQHCKLRLEEEVRYSKSQPDSVTSGSKGVSQTVQLSPAWSQRCNPHSEALSWVFASKQPARHLLGALEELIRIPEMLPRRANTLFSMFGFRS